MATYYARGFVKQDGRTYHVFMSAAGFFVNGDKTDAGVDVETMECILEALNAQAGKW